MDPKDVQSKGTCEGEGGSEGGGKRERDGAQTGKRKSERGSASENSCVRESKGIGERASEHEHNERERARTR